MGSCLSKKRWETKSGCTVAASPFLDPNVPSGSKPSSSDSGHDNKIIVQEEQQPHQEEFEKKKEGTLTETPSLNEDEITEQSRGSHKGLKACDDLSKGGGSSGSAVRTSSCTKEELDAILIQCGRLSRSSSGKGGSSGENQNLRGNRYSGSKRSYDFDHDCQQFNTAEEDKPHTSARLPRRKTPSRERDVGPSQLKRSSSYGEEGSKSSGRRRASRSPGRRSETPIENNKRPIKIVSIPATAPVKRGISTATPTASSSLLKRSGEVIVGGVRSNASPRSRSPATTTGRSAAATENSASQPSLSRNSSRKAEYSPFRRNPMHEIDDNALNIKLQQPATDQCYRSNTNKMPPANIKRAEEGSDMAIPHLQLSDQKSTERAPQMQKQHRKSSPLRKNGIREQLISCRAAELEVQPEVKQETADAKSGLADKDREVSPEALNFQKLTRSRSSRRSRDFDLVANSAHASLLIEDNGQLEPAAFTLPACVSKACSILEAVADLNSSANSNRSSALSYDGGKFFPGADGAHNHLDSTIISRRGEGKLFLGKKTHPFLESEVAVSGDDLTVPSLHKYVTARDFRNGAIDQQESAGSNSFLFLDDDDDDDDTGAVASWDSTDRWTSLSRAIVDLSLQASSSKTETNCGYSKEIGVQTKVDAPT
ncbi:uncharacterized protein At1g65710-like isoform X2 [Aristolochia californica]|uniref:uncharacterized protein At1g65710-like isoform X2 n=1 Tax=Aristolochia californica TaxID=171875 RepID=UPI0035D83492